MSAYADYLNVTVMEKLMKDSMTDVLPISYTPEEYQYAKQFTPNVQDAADAILTAALNTEQKVSAGSTDVGDVSWNIPTGCVYFTTIASESISS